MHTKAFLLDDPPVEGALLAIRGALEDNLGDAKPDDWLECVSREHSDGFLGGTREELEREHEVRPVDFSDQFWSTGSVILHHIDIILDQQFIDISNQEFVSSLEEQDIVIDSQ